MKTAIITGAGRGIGKSIALAFAEEKFNLVLAARSLSELNEVSVLCEKLGAKTHVCITDITSEKDVIYLFNSTKKIFSSVDLLINNAGFGIFKKITETSLDEWQKVIDVNLTGAFLCSREALKIMKPQNQGVIINISSVVGIKGYPNQGAYTASKHGMVGLTKVIAEEGREFGIRAHVICPGAVATEMVKQSRPDIAVDELIQPEDVSELTLYLAKLPKRVSIDLVHLRRFTSQSF